MSKSHAHLPSSIIPFSVISQIATRIRTVPLVVLLIFTVPIWLLSEAIAPEVVRAYTARVDLAIDRLPEENYETILRRAEAAARAAAQRSFDQDILVTDVSIIVSVQSYGAIAPVLTLEVSRSQWRTRPDAQRWAAYFKTARSLLLFEKQTTSNPVPAATTSPAALPQPIKPTTTEKPTD
ncbi:hypothetical protein [aff. Roholtiella sp. LEGE 12411]|uniref:hypothetical protein n=1 Tax=aff. Roholtiella sp. LEGE 12411 TaxID=1828822 RepID=UPI00187EDCA6|nr:hypothetical protein [aff. Roholtiella sp. LEGE 12411]MBE9034581.1 hypothetical protein [aff. Roholtiella sp. LEGE 12411]